MELSSAHDYRFDWAALVAIDAESPRDGTSRSLRVFGFPGRFSAGIGLPAHYLVNTNCAPLGVQVMLLPAIATFKDASVPDRLGITWKLSSSTNVYLETLSLPLCISRSKETGVEVWRKESDAMVTRLSMLKCITAIEDQDGSAMEKQVNKWLANHSPRMKALGIKSIRDARSWSSSGRFSKNVPKIIDQATLQLRKACKAASGGASASSSTSKATKESNVAELAAVDLCCKELEAVRAELLLKAPSYDQPLGSRIIECPLETKDPSGAVDTAVLYELVRSDSAVAALDELLKTDVALTLAGGKAPRLVGAATPMFLAKAPSEAPPSPVKLVDYDDELEVDVQNSHSNSNFDSESDGEEGGGRDDLGAEEEEAEQPRRSNRKLPKPTDNVVDLDDEEQSQSKSTKKSTKKDKKLKAGKRTYVKSGLFRKSALDAAVKRGKVTPDSQGGSDANIDTTPIGISLSNTFQFTVIHCTSVHTHCWLMRPG